MSDGEKGQPLQAVLFDLDGTLIDSGPDICLSLGQVLKAVGLEPLNLQETLDRVGKGSFWLVEQAFAYRGVGLDSEMVKARTAEFAAHYARDCLVETRPYPGVTAMLEDLAGRGIPLGLVTNKLEGITRQVLAGLGYDRFFQVVVGGDSAGARKPDPAPVKHALNALGVRPDQAVLVGDSASDAGAAKAAGTGLIAVSWGYCHGAPGDLESQALVHDVAALQDCLDSLLAGKPFKTGAV